MKISSAQQQLTHVNLTDISRSTCVVVGQGAGDELGAVDELGEVGVGVVWHSQTRERPLLRLLFPPNLHVDDLHLLAVFQRLPERNKFIY